MASQRNANEPYIVITCEEAFANENSESHTAGKDPLSAPWIEQSSAKWIDPSSFGVRQLRRLYPNHSVVAFYNVNILGFPGAYVQPLTPEEMVTETLFYPLARRAGRSTGMLGERVRFGSFRVAWDKYEFILYTVSYLYGFGESSAQFLVSEGPEEPSRALLMAAGIWTNDLHDEIYVFDSGFWYKDHKLWLEVQKADWGDVILKDEFKKRMQKDVFGFFDSEELYKSLAIPWKRGVIMYGPPGNGKTISMKAIMKGCDAKGYYPLYVKSFRSWKGEEGAMADVFEKARQLSPCVIILEDLDSLINTQNRSFFLNQLDGLESNDGLLVIGTTNHLDRIDPSLTARPSRFDRKYEFDDPDAEDRKLYVQYWQQKLKSNKKISFPDSLVDQVVSGTDKFSFAYLKEAFVSTLVLLANEDEDRPFAEVLLDQVKTLKKQLNNGGESKSSFGEDNVATGAARTNPPRLHDLPPRQPTDNRSQRVWETIPRGGQPSRVAMPGEMPQGPSADAGRDGRKDMRSTAIAAARLGRSYFF